jgi:hypothetical protein
MKTGDKKKITWHAVSIATKSTSCEAARALRTARYLSAKAPRLPLAECTTPDACPCAYKHHEDRRGNSRRTEETTGLKRGGKVAQERRVSRGRRQTDA